MAHIKAFDNISDEDIQKLLTCFGARKMHYKKGTTILSNLTNVTDIGIIMKGSAHIIRYNYNGSRSIVETLKEGDTFGEFSASTTEELYIISTDESDVILFGYEHLIKRCKKNCDYHNHFVDNMLQILSEKLRTNNERIEILTKKTIREKLLAYFNLLSKKQITRAITIPFTLTDLADYLSIDRSAMMRELKNLKDEGLIESKNKRMYLKY